MAACLCEAGAAVSSPGLRRVAEHGIMGSREQLSGIIAHQLSAQADDESIKGSEVEVLAVSVRSVQVSSNDASKAGVCVAGTHVDIRDQRACLCTQQSMRTARQDNDPATQISASACACACKLKREVMGCDTWLSTNASSARTLMVPRLEMMSSV